MCTAFKPSSRRSAPPNTTCRISGTSSQLEDGALPHFDIVQQGMGPDAHTASLFPGEPLIDDREGIAAAVYAEKMPQWRITLLPGVLLAARHTVFLVSGEDKAEAVRAVFNDEYDPKRLPAQVVSHHGRGVIWFLDDAASISLRKKVRQDAILPHQDIYSSFMKAPIERREFGKVILGSALAAAAAPSAGKADDVAPLASRHQDFGADAHRSVR